MAILIENIKELIQVEYQPKLLVKGKDMAKMETIQDAFLFIKNEKIESFGKMGELDKPGILSQNPGLEIIDATGKMVFPSFVDSHTHLVYPASREIEYIDKIKGLSYEEIAKRGGGILNSARKMQEASEEALVEDAMKRLDEIIAYGTGAVEIKSGYGLTTESEIKMLRVIRKLKELSPLTIKSTFLGAHSIPLEYRGNQSKYVDLVINEMLPRIAEEGLADYIDVFCDKGFFTVEDTERVLEAGWKYGIQGKIHANEL
ncbi:MAG TPA: imidazolonepropionase, partial [Bacteroidales bacterium]